ncbi:unnamed protein product [Spirodela intermedia]|uniref:Uncharacterized protein n=1 Tax=Spirodela intermedia TaxID=51605 RepID=A0A7I8K304_SPIIN|nr:unnamed protein product [Spirodela intermedia]
MSENREGQEGTSARGADWEVVSLTASAYAAAPGPDLEGADPANSNEAFKRNEEQPSQAMIMSGHFVFPPSEHENLPLEPDNVEILTESFVQGADSVLIEEEAGKSQKEILTLESLMISKADDPHGVQVLGEGKSVAVGGVDFEEGAVSLQGVDLVEERRSIYGVSGFGSFHSETHAGGSVPKDEGSGMADSDDSSDQGSKSPPKSIKKSDHKGFGHPCEAWWKRQVASLCAHAKEASTFWSLCVAAAVMGLVILGQQWQQERWQVRHLKSQLGTSDERMSWLLGRASHLKDSIIGGHRCAPVIHGASSADR